MVDFQYSKNKVFPTQIETERLLLIPITKDKFSLRQVFKQFSSVSDSALEYVFWDEHQNMKETRDWITDQVENFNKAENACYYVIPKSNTNLEDEMKANGDCFIGTTSFDPCWSGEYALSGIFLFQNYWGYGVSSERGEAILKMTFEELDLKWYLGRCSVNNENSQRAIEKYVISNGGKKVGVLPYEKGDTQRVYYKISEQDYS